MSLAQFSRAIEQVEKAPVYRDRNQRRSEAGHARTRPPQSDQAGHELKSTSVDVSADKILYDAQTTSGGSGGPLFNNDRKVIGVNLAMVREFGGSNFAIPIAYGKSLLKP